MLSILLMSSACIQFFFSDVYLQNTYKTVHYFFPIFSLLRFRVIVALPQVMTSVCRFIHKMKMKINMKGHL